MDAIQRLTQDVASFGDSPGEWLLCHIHDDTACVMLGDIRAVLFAYMVLQKHLEHLEERATSRERQ